MICNKEQVVKVIWRKTALPPQTYQSYSPGGANVPSHLGTLAPPGEYSLTCASFGPLDSTTQTANRLVQLLLNSSWHSVVGYVGDTWRIRLKLCTMAPPRAYDWTDASFGPPESSTQTASRSVHPFLQGLLVWQADRPTDHATQLVTTDRIYVHSTGNAV